MRNQLRIILMAAASLVIAAPAFADDDPAALAKQGLEQLSSDPAAAAETLAKVAALRPADAMAAYNHGVALARAGKLDEAAAAFQRADVLSTDPALRADARYNQGVLEVKRAAAPADGKPVNSADAMKAISRAERQFRRSLDASGPSARPNPADTDAPEWIERLQRKRQQLRKEIEQQKQQQQQQQQKQEGQQDPNQQQQEQQGDQQDQQGKQQQQQDGQPGQQQQSPQQGQPSDPSQELQDLARQQSQLSQQSSQSAGQQETAEQREQRQQAQAELSQQTEQAAAQQAERQAQQPQSQPPKPTPTQQKIDQARDEQAKAQEALAKGDDKAAAEAQQKAAQRLAEAAQEAAKEAGQDSEQPPQEGEPQEASGGDPSDQAQGRSAWDFTAAEILDKERRERDVLRRIRRENRRIFVEKDW